MKLCLIKDFQKGLTCEIAVGGNAELLRKYKYPLMDAFFSNAAGCHVRYLRESALRLQY